MFSSKLDKKTAREWEEKRANPPLDENGEKIIPNFEDFINFIKQKADLLETLEFSKPSLRAPRQCQRTQQIGTFSTSEQRQDEKTNM